MIEGDDGSGGSRGEREEGGYPQMIFDYMDWLKAQPAEIRRFAAEEPSERLKRLANLEMPRIIERSPAASPAKS